MSKASWSECFAEIETFYYTLPACHDDEGVDAPRYDLLNDTKRWLRICASRGDGPPDAVYPTHGGTLMTEWHLADSLVVSDHVRTPGQVERLRWWPDRKSEFKIIDIDEEANNAYFEFRKNHY